MQVLAVFLATARAGFMACNLCSHTGPHSEKGPHPWLNVLLSPPGHSKLFLNEKPHFYFALESENYEADLADSLQL